MTNLTKYLNTAVTPGYLGDAQNTIRKRVTRSEVPIHRNPTNGFRLFRRDDPDKFLDPTAKPVNEKTKLS